MAKNKVGSMTKNGDWKTKRTPNTSVISDRKKSGGKSGYNKMNGHIYGNPGSHY